MRDEWKVVESEDELRLGMCVELRPCDCASCCGLANRRIMLASGPYVARTCANCGGLKSHQTADGQQFCPCRAIRERRLYRLRDDDTAADETATTKRRTREVAR